MLCSAISQKREVIFLHWEPFPFLLFFSSFYSWHFGFVVPENSWGKILNEFLQFQSPCPYFGSKWQKWARILKCMFAMLVTGIFGSHGRRVERNARKMKRIFRQKLVRKSERRTGRVRWFEAKMWALSSLTDIYGPGMRRAHRGASFCPDWCGIFRIR